MKIKTKYDIEEMVYYFTQEGVIEKGKIIKITIISNKILYTISTRKKFETLGENELASTKKKLIKKYKSSIVRVNRYK